MRIIIFYTFYAANLTFNAAKASFLKDQNKKDILKVNILYWDS